MTAGRKALLVVTYAYDDPGLRRLTAPGHDAEALADVLRAPEIAGAIEIVVQRPTGFDLGAVGRGLLAVLVALAACYAAQLLPGRGRSSEERAVTG